MIINGTGVLGQMRKLWSLTESRDETYSGSRNGQPHQKQVKGTDEHGTDCRIMRTQALVNLSQMTAKPSHNPGRRKGSENTPTDLVLFIFFRGEGGGQTQFSKYSRSNHLRNSEKWS